jgi:hypothetical protein
LILPRLTDTIVRIGAKSSDAVRWNERGLVPPLWGIQNASFISAPVLIH